MPACLTSSGHCSRFSGVDAVAGIPFAWLRLDRTGRSLASEKIAAPMGTTDLLVLAHGWKNDQDSAAKLYEAMLRSASLSGPDGLEVGRRRFLSIGVGWPSLRYAPDLSLVDAVPPGEASASPAALEGLDVDRNLLAGQARSFGASIGLTDQEDFARAAILASGGGGAADDFIDIVRAHLTPSSTWADVAADHSELLSASGADLVQGFIDGSGRGSPMNPPGDDRASMGTGGLENPPGTSWWRLLSGGRAAVASLLNQATYYEMKVRAGSAGTGVAELLGDPSMRNMRVHLVGHSFGCRLVCAAAQVTNPASLTLLQGALSHNALGKDVGAGKSSGVFRTIVEDGRVDGPIVVSHTRNDVAVGIYYPLASILAGDRTSSFGMREAIGGPGDPYGGMGANGALSLADGEAMALVAKVGVELSLTPGKVNNVLADDIISDHNDVLNVEVGALVRSAVS